MKTIKKLLCTLVVLTLVFCSLSTVMTAGATNTKKDAKAFKSVTVNGKKVKHFEDDPAEVGSKSKTPKVKVKLNSGWKLKSICYNHGEGTKSKKIKNGGKMKLKGTFENYLVIKAKKGSTTAKVEICVYKD